jgi:asparagine synthase (glutamine-hydrolysing)
MSVQAGVWNYNGKPVDRKFLAKISRELAEYGPDGETTFFDDSVGMVYRPFHTTSESRLERQPHVFASGKVFTWDGRLDNREELMPQLHNDLVGDHTDLAIVGAAFERWGTECFAKLIGDWALAIWDPNNRELILARDYAGIRHLFYYPKPKCVMWSTHLEPLAMCGDQFTLCDEYFAGYLANYPEAHLTPYCEIHSVSPGKFVTVRSEKVWELPYWTFNPRLRTSYKTDDEYEEHFRHLFRHAVRQRLRTDSPILADLSGGLDSSSIICMADKILADEGRQDVLLDTFFAFVRDEPGEEDSRYVGTVEQRRGRMGHHVELLGGKNAFAFEYSRFVATPGLDSREDLRLAQSEIIKTGGYRVLLSGTGGDEMLGQALDPRIQLADLLRQLRLGELTKQLIAWSLLLRRPWLHLFLNAFLLQLPASIRARNADIAKVEPWVNGRFARRQKLSSRQLHGPEGSFFWLPSVRDWFHTLMTLTRQRTHAWPSREETRWPYLDQRLVEFLTSIPTEQLLRPNHRRSLMRRALVGILPPELLARQSKSMGGRSLVVSVEGNWDKFESILRSPLIARLGYLNQQQFRASLVRLKNGDLSPYFLRAIRALSWELWLREAIARRVIAPQPGMEVTIGAGLVQSRA